MRTKIVVYSIRICGCTPLQKNLIFVLTNNVQHVRLCTEAKLAEATRWRPSIGSSESDLGLLEIRNHDFMFLKEVMMDYAISNNDIVEVNLYEQLLKFISLFRFAHRAKYDECGFFH